MRIALALNVSPVDFVALSCEGMYTESGAVESVDWEERKTYYGEHFFTEKCNYFEDGKARYDTCLDFPSWLFRVSGNPETVLDCGCATGDLMFGFFRLKRALQVWGFDLSEYAVSRGITTVKERMFLLDCAMEAIPFPDEYFDLCTAIEFFEHQDDANIERVVEEITGVTKNYIFARQPFTKFNMPVDKRAEFLVGLNAMAHADRLNLIDRIPEITTSVPDPNCPYHPQERGRDFFLDLFAKYHFEEQELEEEDYKYPNAGSICSFNTLLLRRVDSL